MIYGLIIAFMLLALLVTTHKWLTAHTEKTFYSINQEGDANGNTIYKLYIVTDSGGRQYIGKFDNVDTAKAKIAALKEKAAKEAEALLKSTIKTEVYREDM